MANPRSRKLRLPPGELKPAVIEAFANILAYASDSLGELSADPGKAVHEYRKSLRRARSLVRLLRPSLSRTSRRRLEMPLRESHRALSGDRDRMVLIETWRRLSEQTGLELPELEAALEAREPPPPSGAAARRYFGDLIEHLEDRLPDPLGVNALASGLASTYRAARVELQRARQVADPVHVHALRRRCKDLNYQLELLRPLGRKRVAKPRKQFAALAAELGLITDLYHLRDVARELDPPLERHARIALDAALDSEIARRVETSLGRAKKRLKKKPKKWVKRLALG